MKLKDKKELTKIKSYLVKKMSLDNELNNYIKDIELLNLKSFETLVKVFKNLDNKVSITNCIDTNKTVELVLSK